MTGHKSWVVPIRYAPLFCYECRSDNPKFELTSSQNSFAAGSNAATATSKTARNVKLSIFTDTKISSLCVTNALNYAFNRAPRYKPLDTTTSLGSDYFSVTAAMISTMIERLCPLVSLR